MNRTEKIFLLVILITLPLLAFKSIRLDGYEPAPEEASVVVRFEEHVAERYDHLLYDYHLLTIRLIGLETLQLDGREQAVAKYRKYLVGIFPFFDVYIKEEAL